MLPAAFMKGEQGVAIVSNATMQAALHYKLVSPCV